MENSIRFIQDKKSINSDHIFNVVSKLPEYIVADAHPLIRKAFEHGKVIAAYNRIERMMGFLIYSNKRKNEVEIEWIAVLPTKQKQGIGKALMQYAMEDRRKKYYLLTGTQDSKIPGTSFNAQKLINNYEFFQNIGFRVIRKLPKHFGPLNHAWEWKFNAEMNNLIDQKRLAKIGRVIRPILNGLAIEFKLNKGILGICFNIPNSDPIFFAEKIKNETPLEKIYEQKYTISRWSEFVTAIVNSSNNTSFGFDFNKDETYKDLIRTPIEEEFKPLKKNININVVVLNKNKCIFYIITEKAQAQEILFTLSSLKYTLSALLHQILFYVRSRNYDLSDLVGLLRKCLPEVPSIYSKIQLHILKMLSHPLSRIIANYRMSRIEIQDKTNLLNKSANRLLQNINGYEKIVVNKNLSGSLQAKSVLQADLFPRGSTKSFPAVIKFSSIDSSIKDLSGFRILNNYYDSIGNFLPPAAEYWNVVKGRNLTDDIIITIPKLSGSSLYEFIKDNGIGGKNSELEIIDIISKLKQFIKEINKTELKKITIRKILFDKYFSKKDRAPKRFLKTIKLFRLGNLREAKQHLIVNNLQIINPFFFFRNYTKYKLKNKSQFVREFNYGHGDFHLGNFIYNEDDKLIVFDFDYVDKYPEHYDLSTLEASIMLTIVSSLKDLNFNRWEKQIFPIIENLETLNIKSDNTVAKRLKKILRLFPNRSSDAYKMCLLVAYLRLITSYCRGKKLKEIEGLLMTGIFIIGKLISDLFDPLKKYVEVQEINYFDES